MMEFKMDINSNLLSAVVVGNIKGVTSLLESGADINIKDRFGFTPLMQAVDLFHDNLVELLLERNANISLENEKDETAYDIAVRKNNHKAMKAIKDYELKHNHNLMPA